jgi:hypothetical protein
MEMIECDLEANLAASREALVQTGQRGLLAERVALTAAAEEELARLCHDLKVKVEEEKACREESLATAVRRSSHLAAKASPAVATNKARKLSAGKEQKTALTLDTRVLSGESDNDNGSLYAPSLPAGLSDSMHAPSPSRSDPTPTAASFSLPWAESMTPTPTHLPLPLA